ncbi:AAA family ATPase [Methylorubrum aminovorans]
MTDEIRRAERARAQSPAYTPPETVTAPATLRQLRYGWPLYWGHPGPDLLAWSRSIPLDRLPRGVRDALAALDEGTITAAAASALAEAFADAAADTRLRKEVREDCEEYASRCRLNAAWLGDYANAVLAMHETDVYLGGTFDDCERRALMVTRTEFSYLGHQILQGGHDPKHPVPRAQMRERAWQDLLSESEVVRFCAALDQGETRSAIRAVVRRGPVRDDTGTDPRDPDFDPLDLGDEVAGPPPDTLLALPRLGAGLKPDALKELKAAVGAIVGKHLPLVTVPASWAGFVAALDAEFPQFADVTRAIVRLQGGRRTWGGLRVILTGPPGAGKTRYVRRLCELAGLHLARIPCDASADNSSVAATPRRWQTGHPCRALAEMVASMTANPAMLLDELGRASGTQQSNGGRLYDALVGMTDPENASAYHDQFVEAQADLSHVPWIATANDVASVPAALLDRFVQLDCALPGPEHLRILAPQVSREACRQRGLDEAWGTLDETDLSLLAQHWRGGSMRRLARLVDVLMAVRLDPSSGPRH